MKNWHLLFGILGATTGTLIMYIYESIIKSQRSVFGYILLFFLFILFYFMRVEAQESAAISAGEFSPGRREIPFVEFFGSERSFSLKIAEFSGVAEGVFSERSSEETAEESELFYYYETELTFVFPASEVDVSSADFDLKGRRNDIVIEMGLYHRLGQTCLRKARQILEFKNLLCPKMYVHGIASSQTHPWKPRQSRFSCIM